MEHAATPTSCNTEPKHVEASSIWKELRYADLGGRSRAARMGGLAVCPVEVGARGGFHGEIGRLDPRGGLGLRRRSLRNSWGLVSGFG